MGLKEADESKLLSRLEKLGRDVSALRWSLTLSSLNKRLPLRAEQAKLNSGLDVCLGKADNLGIAPNTFSFCKVKINDPEKRGNGSISNTKSVKC